MIWLGRERNIRQEETGAQYSLRFGGDRSKQSEDRIAPPFSLSIGRGENSLAADYPASLIFSINPYVRLWVFIIHTNENLGYRYIGNAQGISEKQ